MSATPTNLHRDLGRMEGKLDAVLSEMRSGLRSAHDRLDKHETEIEALKTRNTEQTGALKTIRWLWASLLGAAGLVAGAFGSGYVR